MWRQSYVYQAVRLGRDGAVELVCHERPFRASDECSAIVTAEAMHEVLHTQDCNALRVLSEAREILWTREFVNEEQSHWPDVNGGPGRS